MTPLRRILPNKKRDEVNGFFINAIKKMITSREQQDPNQRRRDFLQLMLDARSSTNDVIMEHLDGVSPAEVSIRKSQTAANQALPRKQRQRLSDDEIAGQASLFLVAGYETTNSALSFATYLLATHPECQERLLQEVDDFFKEHQKKPELSEYESKRKR
ncbi:hypothetical protein JRQ81_015263 [Phrynocephalus forsythii]|uniref:Cytochrome P450 n=1 Tax=Phrynocephalus forsythii TaxID=171643 RepID=A0A9Q1B1Z6_9SAUR|nr:hypothetical protein JRQ81_015263 [Phrynocephalus forsythii]